jgi:hypothetical protein
LRAREDRFESRARDVEARGPAREQNEERPARPAPRFEDDAIYTEERGGAADRTDRTERERPSRTRERARNRERVRELERERR